jgi:hydroxypyruvate reductase
MTNREHTVRLRLSARAIFDEALRAVDAGEAVRRAVRVEGSELKIRDATLALGANDQRVYSIAIGKAAVAMAGALAQILGGRLAAGIISGAFASRRMAQVTALSSQNSFDPKRWQIFSGGHPLPNEASLAAARAAFALLERADEEGGLVIFLVSGGGSAMIEWPIDDSITLGNLCETNQILVDCGASITEINAVRRAFSAVKGGRLAARAPHCDQITLIVSDVPTGDEASVASGPSLLLTAEEPDVSEVLARHDLRSRLPQTVLHAIESRHRQESGVGEHSLGSSQAPNVQARDSNRPPLHRPFVLLDNRSALEAAAEAARRRGFITEIADDISDQPIAEGCAQLFQRLKQLRAQAAISADRNDKSKEVCLISGGEFACPVRGRGVGGRNLETALRLARSTSLSLSDTGHFVALCAGTDGIDGNSPAAGAIVDYTTIERAGAVGLDADDCLNRSDSYSFFVALGDAITTGATGTNVRDLRILLAEI